MLGRLTKLAARAAEIREASMEKEAFLGKALNVLGAGATIVSTPGAMASKYRESKAGFDPAVQKMMMGQTPVPPTKVNAP